MNVFDSTEVVSPTPAAQGLNGERPRNVKRVRVRAKLRRGANSCSWPGKSVRRLGLDRLSRFVGDTDENGEFESVIYIDTYKSLVESKVETDLELWDRAVAKCHELLQKHVRAEAARDKKRRPIPNRPLPTDREEWTANETEFASSFFGESPESIFRGMTDRSPRPLEWIKIVEELPAPMAPEVQAMKDAATALRDSRDPGADRIKQLENELASLKALIQKKSEK